MYSLSRPIAELYCLTGYSIDADLSNALSCLSGIHVPEQLREMQKKRVEAAFKGEKADQIPVGADIRWWIVEQYHDGTLEQKLESCDPDKIFMYFPQPRTPYMIEPISEIDTEVFWSGASVVYRNGGYPGTKRTMKIDTPRGTLTASEAYASRSFGIVEYPVKNIDDLDIVRYIYEKRASAPFDEAAPASFVAPMTPIQILLVHLAGVETTALLLADHQDEIEDFMEFLDDIHKPVTEYLAKNGNSIFSVENLSADISAGYFDKYLGPQLMKRKVTADKYGVNLGVHHDGKLQPLFGRLKEVGVNYANGITAAPSGDVELENIREAAGDDMILVDIIPQCIFTESFDIDYFRDYIKRAANVFKDDNKVILGIGDMLPCNADIKRFEIMTDIIAEESLSL